MQKQRLTYFLRLMPVSMFGGVMGLTGLSFAWHLAGSGNLFKGIGNSIGIAATIAFLLLTILYLIKWKKFPETVHNELHHPVSVSFFGTFIISLLLLPGVIKTWSIEGAMIMWCIATALMFLFAVYTLRFWLSLPKSIDQIHPAWILPVVGTLDVPIVGMQLPVQGVREICTFFFSIGLVFTVILFAILFVRLTIMPLPPEQQAPLLIMTGPLALAFTCYESLNQADLFSDIFLYTDLFLLVLFGSKVILLPFRYGFRLNWWSVSFPLTAITTASHRFSLHHQHIAFNVLYWILLSVTTVTILFLLLQTLYHYFAASFVEDETLHA